MNETINETVIPLLLGHTAPFTNSPTMDIFLLALIGALFTTLVNKYLSDQVKIKALRKDMKDLQKKMRNVMQKDPQKAQKLQKEIMKKNMENMKHSMNPKILLTTMLPMLFLFFFIRKYYSQFGEFLNLGFTTFGWLGSYIVFSIILSIALKKLLKVA